MNFKTSSLVSLLSLAAAFGSFAPTQAAQPETMDIRNAKDHVSDGRGVVGHRRAEDGSPRAAGPTGQASTVITYHNGPVMLNTVNVYVIWYGNWAGNTATTIIPDFLNNLGGSPYWNINTTYYNGAGTHLANSVAFLGSTTDNYSLGKNLSDANIRTVVSSAITSGRLPKDAAGIYLVLTAADVTAKSGFCTRYCGWHTYSTISSTTIKYAFVGNAARCLNSCAAQSVGPNGNAGADAMISVIAHELEEAATDPQLNAWYDGSGAENADKCSWSFGTTSVLPTGAKYNMTLGTRKYLVQQNWVNSGAGYCALKY